MREGNEHRRLSPAEVLALARLRKKRRSSESALRGFTPITPAQSAGLSEQTSVESRHNSLWKPEPAEVIGQTPVESRHNSLWKPEPAEVIGQTPIESISKDREAGKPKVEAAGPDVTEAAADAAASIIAEPFTNVVIVGVGSLENAGTNAAVGELIDKFCEVALDFADPGRLPSALVSKAVTHLLTPLATAAFGPIGPVIAIFVGNFAGELTHQVIDASLDSTGIQHAESAIELVGAFTDARIGRLADSQPFADYVSGLIGGQIAAIIDTSGDEADDHKSEPITGRASRITAIIAVYEIEISPNKFRAAETACQSSLRVWPASLAVLECISTGAVVRRIWEGLYEYLLLADGTALRRGIDGHWSRISILERFRLFGE